MEGQYAQIVVVAVLSFAAAIFIVLRLWAKSRRRTFGIDDVLIIIGMALTVVLGIQDILWVVKGHEGVRMRDLDQPKRVQFLKYFAANQITYTVVPLPVKLSILSSYWKIFGAFRYFQISSYIVGGMTIAWSIIMVFLCIFQCRPPHAFWDHVGSDTQHCGDLTRYAWGNAISNLAIDVIILCMPALPLWQLQISSLQRKLAFGSFALGFFVCVASILRITTIPNVANADLSHAIVPPATWTFIEPSVGIISACLPFLRPLISRSPRNTDYNYNRSRSGKGTTPVPYGAEEAPSQVKRQVPSISALQRGSTNMGTSASQRYAQLTSPTQESIELQTMKSKSHDSNDNRSIGGGPLR